MMEFHDQEMVKDQTNMILKGKRTKRQRPMSPLVLTMATTISSSSSGVLTDDGGGFCDLNLSCGGVGGGGADRFTISSSESGEFIQNTLDDEEDMANCLILLAQGHHQSQRPSSSKQINLSISDHAKATIPEVYGCKTCNRYFPTFQALGGHRASHRKPKLALQEDNNKKSPTEGSLLEKSHNTCSNSTTTTNNKSRVHECLTCGAEFSSGQALGGHMRRHRPLPVAAAGASSSTHDDDCQEVKKSKLELLGLDLNLPAPEDIDHRGSKFSFASKDQVRPVSQLVDCHY